MGRKSILHFQYPKSALPRLVLAGNSNVGKSSLARTLLSKPGLYKGKIGKTPGSTITPVLVADTARGYQLVDLPGYGRMVRLTASAEARVKYRIAAYLRRDAPNIFLLLVVMAADRVADTLEKWYDPEEGRLPVSFEFLRFAWANDVPCALVINKMDKVPRFQLEALVARCREALTELGITDVEPGSPAGFLGIRVVSARENMGLNDFFDLVDARRDLFYTLRREAWVESLRQRPLDLWSAPLSPEEAVIPELNRFTQDLGDDTGGEDPTEGDPEGTPTPSPKMSESRKFQVVERSSGRRRSKKASRPGHRQPSPKTTSRPQMRRRPIKRKGGRT
jgi:GTP-binding protein EngB required for normal cell division